MVITPDVVAKQKVVQAVQRYAQTLVEGFWKKIGWKTPEVTVTPPVAPATEAVVLALPAPPVLTPFEKARAKFNPAKDIMVISEPTADALSEEERTWLSEQGDKIFVFKGDLLINVALVSTGYGW